MILCYQNSISKKLDFVDYQYSGAVHDVIPGIGMVNLLYHDTKTEQSIPVDYTGSNSKTKNDYFVRYFF